MHGEGEQRSYFYAHLPRPSPVHRGQRVWTGERVERNTQTFERVMSSLDRNEERLGQLEQVVEENKTFIRNMTRRTEKIVQDLVQRNEKALRRETDEILRAMRVRSRSGIRRAEEDLAEWEVEREKSRALRRELLERIDRLPPPANAA